MRCQVILPHELTDASAGLPLLAGYLVATDVKERIGKQRGHFADEGVQKLIGGFARRVQGRIEHAPVALDLIGSGRTGELRIPDQPTGGVARHVELGNHANTAVLRVGDHLANLFLRIINAIGTELLKLWKTLALDTETLVVGEMPMEDVQLHRGHAVEIAFDHFDGHPMPGYIQMQAAPRETGMVLDVDDRQFRALGCETTSCRNVSRPRSTPSGLGADNEPPRGVIARR